MHVPGMQTILAAMQKSMMGCTDEFQGIKMHHDLVVRLNHARCGQLTRYHGSVVAVATVLYRRTISSVYALVQLSSDAVFY